MRIKYLALISTFFIISAGNSNLVGATLAETIKTLWPKAETLEDIWPNALEGLKSFLKTLGVPLTQEREDYLNKNWRYLLKEQKIIDQMNTAPGNYAVNPAKTAATLRLMTYNIQRGPSQWFRTLFQNRWAHQLPMIVDMLKKYQPTIFGTQELGRQTQDDLIKNLPDYKWVGRSSKGTDLSEYSAIFYNTKEVELLEQDTFWLNETQTEHQPGWGATIPRNCTWAKFRRKTDNKIFWVFNTHLDHESRDARVKGAAMIANAILQRVSHNELAFILGDFNSYGGYADQLLVQLYKEPWSFSHTKDLAAQKFGPTHTFTSWPAATHSLIIDHILVNNKDLFDVDWYGVIEREDKSKASDHSPVMADIRFKE